MIWTGLRKANLRNNIVTVARMFEHRFHVFLRDVIMSPDWENYRLFPKSRVSPHMHYLFWIDGAQKLDEDGETAVCEFIDKM